MTSPVVEDELLRAAAQVIAAGGPTELTLDRVAAAAGVSRVTLYRRGITKELLLAGLARRAAEGWQALMWPALTGPGTAAERLVRALRAGCAAVEGQLPLLAGLGALSVPPLAPGDERGTRDEVYVAPFVRLLRDAAADRSLAICTDPEATATTVVASFPHTYITLRATHGWEAERATDHIVELLLSGLLPRPSDRPAST